MVVVWEKSERRFSRRNDSKIYIKKRLSPPLTCGKKASAIINMKSKRRTTINRTIQGWLCGTAASRVIGCLHFLSGFPCRLNDLWKVTIEHECFLMIESHNTTEERIFTFVVLFFCMLLVGEVWRDYFFSKQWKFFLFLLSSSPSV